MGGIHCSSGTGGMSVTSRLMWPEASLLISTPGGRMDHHCMELILSPCASIKRRSVLLASPFWNDSKGVNA